MTNQFVLVLLAISVGPSMHNEVEDEFCCSVNSNCFPSQSSIAKLNNVLDGRVYMPNMDEYINQSHMYNTIEQRSPSMIVMVHSKEDIQQAVLFARKYNMRVSIRSSGHDYSGRSTWEGSMNINLSEMKEYEVTLDSSRHQYGEVKLQTGLRWIDIYTLLHDYNRTIVGGSGKTVTPGGYTQGGGHSPISKMFGYAVDNVLEIQVVLPDGRIATCTESKTILEDPDGTTTTVDDGDLFWALRGGGGGTFGVVVYYVFKLHPPPSGMVVVNTFIPLKIANFGLDLTEQVFDIVNSFKDLPNEWGGYFLFDNTKLKIPVKIDGKDIVLDTTGNMKLHMNKYGAWDGTEETILKALMDFSKEYDMPVTFDNVSTYLEYAEKAYDPDIVRVYLANTLLQPEKQNEEFSQFIHTELYESFGEAYFGCTGVLLGGATKSPSIDSTPLRPSFRTASASLTCGVGLSDPHTVPWFQQSTYDDLLIGLADAFSERLQKFGDGMYLNEPTKNHPRWKEAFWGVHYERLLSIKRFYDPELFFTCHHCVGSDLRSSMNKYTSNTATKRTGSS